MRGCACWHDGVGGGGAGIWMCILFFGEGEKDMGRYIFYKKNSAQPANIYHSPLEGAPKAQIF